MGSRIASQEASGQPRSGVMGNSQTPCYSAVLGRKRKDCTRVWIALVANTKVWEESVRHWEGNTMPCTHYRVKQECVAPEL